MSSLTLFVALFGIVSAAFILRTGMLTRYSPGGIALENVQLPRFPLVLIGEEVKLPPAPESETTCPSRRSMRNAPPVLLIATETDFGAVFSASAASISVRTLFASWRTFWNHFF